MHCLFEPEEVQQALDKNDGAIATILDAQKAGVIKHIGFSAHTTRAAIAALQGFEFDTVMFPINFVELEHDRHGKGTSSNWRKKQDAGIIAIKGDIQGGVASRERSRKVPGGIAGRTNRRN